MKRMGTYKSIAAEGKPEQLFMGGTLNLQVVDGEKIVDGNGQNIFGTGTFDSCVEVLCGTQLMAKSIVKNAMLEFRVGRRRWDGFDSTLRPIIITPNLPAVVTLKIFECDRERKGDVLGEASLNIVDIIVGRSNAEILPIVKADEVFISGMSDVVGKVHVKASFIPFETQIVTANATFPLLENISKNLGRFAIGVGYNTVLKDKISISLAMFNKEGNFVDAVSLHKKNNTKGLTSCYETVVPHTGYLQDQHEISFELGNTPDNVKAVFLVLSDCTEFGSLENLKDMYVRIKENKFKKELYRYQGLVIDKPATSGVLLRLVRDDADPKVWQVLTYDSVWSFDAREHGFLIPRLKSMLQDVIPECTFSNNDRMATLDIEESMCLQDYCTTLPAEFSIGLNWETVRGRTMSVDLGCVMLGPKWEYLDVVNSEQLQSTCGSVKHGGEEQRDLGGDKDDQMIHFTLASVPENVSYICFYVISKDAENKLSSGVSCSGKLMDKATERVLSVFTIEDRKQFDYYIAMHMCFCFLLDGQWYFQVANGGAPCTETPLVAEHAKKYLMDKRATQRRTQINTNNKKLIKRYEQSGK